MNWFLSTILAVTLQGTVHQAPEPIRSSPWTSVICYGGREVKLGTEIRPDFRASTLFYLGCRVYVWQGDVFMGVIDDRWAFTPAEDCPISWVQPRIEDRYAATLPEKEVIISRVRWIN